MEDYSDELNGLPKANALKYYTETGTVIVRPSSPEPKLKICINVPQIDEVEAGRIEKIVSAIESRI